MNAERRERARALYEWLLPANPHLPNADHVSADRPIELSFGVENFTQLTFTVLVELPGAESLPGADQ